MRAQRICILGGSGFVGHHLIARLAAEQRDITVVTRRREQHRDLLVLPTVQVVEANIHDAQQLQRVLRGHDAVVNLVGILNERGHDGEGFRRAHVELPRKVVEACRTLGIHRLLHMSALGADATAGHSHYQRTKGEGEALVHGVRDLHTTSFRPSVIFGPGDSFFLRFAALLKRIPILFPLACADARFAPVYVRNVAEAYARALDDPHTHGQSYALCGPREYTLQELLAFTARTLGLRRYIVPLGPGLSKLQANLLEYLPGKPLSRDNYLSMQVPNICDGPFPERFGITPQSVEVVVPTYLSGAPQTRHFAQLRARARRG